MAKQLLYTDDAARSSSAAPRNSHGPSHHPRADRPERHHRQVVRRPHRHQGRRHGLQGDRPADAFENMAPSSSNAVAQKTSDAAATAPPPPPCSPWPSTRKASGTRPSAATRWPSSAASTRPSPRPSSTRRVAHKKLTARRDAARRQHLGEQRPEDRLADGHAFEKVRQGRRSSRRGGQDLRDDG